RYFNFDLPTKRHALRPDIRQMVTFAPLNLIEDDYPALQNNTVSMDLILCRNVTIYFTEADTRRVVQRFYEALVQDGWLVIGHSEPSPAVYGAFQPRTWPNALLYQKTGQPHVWADNWAWLQSVTIPPPTNSLATLPNKVDPFIPVSTQAEADLLFGQNHHPFVTPLLSPPVPTSASSPPLLETDSCQIAAALLSRGHISEAVHELQRQLSIDPHLAAAHTLLGRAYANLGQWSEAQRYCQSAIELDKLQAEAYYLLGLIYEQEAQFESAIAMLKKAIYLEPAMPLPHLNLALLYKQSGQKKNAERACRNTIKILEKYTPTDIVPYSGGASAQYLLVAARRILHELEN
ncbi:MAG TPA: CheR family methyltransferase, partial [Anaerolineae bacterium]|nr:CheR family methyltransferase [Anaerolineae bacterium]